VVRGRARRAVVVANAVEMGLMLRARDAALRSFTLVGSLRFEFRVFSGDSGQALPRRGRMGLGIAHSRPTAGVRLRRNCSREEERGPALKSY